MQSTMGHTLKMHFFLGAKQDSTIISAIEDDYTQAEVAKYLEVRGRMFAR